MEPDFYSAVAYSALCPHPPPTIPPTTTTTAAATQPSRTRTRLASSPSASRSLFFTGMKILKLHRLPLRPASQKFQPTHTHTHTHVYTLTLNGRLTGLPIYYKCYSLLLEFISFFIVLLLFPFCFFFFFFFVFCFLSVFLFFFFQAT
jgi:hypothetical protein